MPLPTTGAGQSAGSFSVFVDAVGGNDANDGLTRDTPKQTLAAVWAVFQGLGDVGTIYVTSTSENPLASNWTITNYDVTLRGLDGNMWYIDRAYTYTAGWANEGGGIYSRAWGLGALGVFVPTILTNSLPTELDFAGAIINPAAGEYSISGGRMYIHLPAGEDPNSETVKARRAGTVITTAGTTRLRMYDGVLGYCAGGAALTAGGSGGAELHDCVLWCSVNGISASVLVVAHDCGLHLNDNDGINVNNADAHLFNCVSSYNDDEGMSGHGASRLYVTDSRTHHNQQAGIWSVDTTTQYLDGLLADNNGLGGGAAQQICGIGYPAGGSGTCTNCTCQNNIGSGFYCAGAATAITVTNLTSGIAEGNGQADVACA